MKLLASGKLPADKMITHHFKFGDTEKAYQTFQAARTEKSLKVLITM